MKVFLILVTLLVLPLVTITIAQETQEGNKVVTITNSILDDRGNLIISGTTVSDKIFVAKISEDGEILWEDTFGGNSTTQYVDVLAIDDVGNIVALGVTGADDFPTQNAFQPNFGGIEDLFIRKWLPDGKLIWSSYFGGDNYDWGSFYDSGLQFDNENNLIISGYTGSNDFPTANGFQTVNNGGGYGSQRVAGDPFIAKISDNGDLLWSSYIGGSGMNGEVLFAVTDQSSNIYVGGGSASADFPTTSGAFQTNFQGGFADDTLTKISPDGKLLWSTYFGGKRDEIVANVPIILDHNNNIYHFSTSNSEDHSLVNSSNVFHDKLGGYNEGTVAQRDIALTKFSSTGDLLWGTFIGGSGLEPPSLGGGHYGHQFTDTSLRTILDSASNLIIMGKTTSVDFPVENEIQSTFNSSGPISDTIFVTKFMENGDRGFSTYLGGSNNPKMGNLHITSQDNILMTGQTWSIYHPTTFGSVQSSSGGQEDIFITQYSANNNVMWSTYLGGDGIENLRSSHVDNLGNVYIMGETSSLSLPGLINVEEDMVESINGFVSKFDINGNLQWTTLIGGSSEEHFNKYSIQINENGRLYLMGKSDSDDMKEIDSDSGFLMIFDENGEEVSRISLASDINITTSQDYSTLVAIVATILTMGILGGLLSSKKSTKILLNPRIEEVLAPIFNSKPSLVYLFIGQSVIKDKTLESDLRKEIPKEMSDYKNIFHPMRLAIVKLLYENTQMTSIEIRETLDIAWGEVTNHVNSLKKQDYVIVEQKFVDGITRMVITPQPKLITHYQNLRELLFEFLQTGPDFDRYLEQVLSIRQKASGEDLYPHTN